MSRHFSLTALAALLLSIAASAGGSMMIDGSVYSITGEYYVIKTRQNKLYYLTKVLLPQRDRAVLDRAQSGKVQVRASFDAIAGMKDAPRSPASKVR